MTWTLLLETPLGLFTYSCEICTWFCIVYNKLWLSYLVIVASSGNAALLKCSPTSKLWLVQTETTVATVVSQAGWTASTMFPLHTWMNIKKCLKLEVGRIVHFLTTCSGSMVRRHILLITSRVGGTSATVRCSGKVGLNLLCCLSRYYWQE